MNAGEIKALVNACNPWNKGAATQWNGWMFGISSASLVNVNLSAPAEPGTVLAVNPTHGLIIACKNGEALRADVVYCEEGFFPGYQLAGFGLQHGNKLV